MDAKLTQNRFTLVSRVWLSTDNTVKDFIVLDDEYAN